VEGDEEGSCARCQRLSRACHWRARAKRGTFTGRKRNDESVFGEEGTDGERHARHRSSPQRSEVRSDGSISDHRSQSPASRRRSPVDLDRTYAPRVGDEVEHGSSAAAGGQRQPENRPLADVQSVDSRSQRSQSRVNPVRGRGAGEHRHHPPRLEALMARKSELMQLVRTYFGTVHCEFRLRPISPSPSPRLVLASSCHTQTTGSSPSSTNRASYASSR
jgi:hypothetical protein